jgi:hypothetical protein
VWGCQKYNVFGDKDTRPKHSSMEGAYVKFINDFEATFLFGGNGAMLCDESIRMKVTQFYGEYSLVISVANGGIEISTPTLLTPGHKDIATTNANKLEMQRAYAFAFFAYQYVCKALKRQIKPDYCVAERAMIKISGEEDAAGSSFHFLVCSINFNLSRIFSADSESK